MACITDIVLDNITLDCNDIPTGGLKSIYISSACDVALGFVDKEIMDDLSVNPKYGEVTCIGFNPSANPEIGEVWKIEFNKKDGVTGFIENKTVDPSGLTTNIPTVTIEFPKMTLEKRNLLNDILNPNVTSIVFIETAAGTFHTLGAKYGMRASSGDGATGTGRTDKNVYTLILVGEEAELSYDTETLWANVEDRVSVDTTGATNVDWEDDQTTNESTVPRQDCIPVPAV